MLCPHCKQVISWPKSARKSRFPKFRRDLFRLVSEFPGRSPNEYTKMFKKKHRMYRGEHSEGGWRSENLADASVGSTLSILHTFGILRRERPVVCTKSGRQSKNAPYRYYVVEGACEPAVLELEI